MIDSVTGYDVDEQMDFWVAVSLRTHNGFPVSSYERAPFEEFNLYYNFFENKQARKAVIESRPNSDLPEGVCLDPELLAAEVLQRDK